MQIFSSYLNDGKLDLDLVMQLTSYRAKKNGLTPEILEQILQEENP